MEAKYLMIEDWLSYDGEPYQVYSREVGRICFQMNPHLKIDVPETDLLLKPIPLTREIFKKNGFVDWSDHSRTTRSCHILLDKNTSIGVQVTDGNDSIFLQIHRYGAGSFELRMSIKYVHQLQHALRLVGIEKEIVI